MIRPYLTVFKDSFHEAFASRVLWVALVVATLVLAALAPLGLDEMRATQLFPGSVRDWPSFLRQISQQSTAADASPGKQIWKLAGDEFRRTVDETTRPVSPKEISRDTVPKLLDALNQVLTKREFHDRDAWSKVTIPSVTQELLGRGIDKLPPEDLFLVNRQLLKAAFPADIANTPEEQLVVTYFGRPVGSPLPVNRRLADPIIRRIVGQVMNFFVGTIGVFVAILVTSAVIPQTFEPGAVDLLLSKPVSRPLLFLVKFFGGCAFILLTGGYFIVGLWAIMGWRFQAWDQSLLLCIPLFLFLFLIYYSVSALAGVLWRNPILSVVVTILFWATCFSVGVAKESLEQWFINPSRIVSIMPTGENLMAVNQSGTFLEWRGGNWVPAFQSERRDGPPFGPGPVLVGPVYNTKLKKLLFMWRTPPRRFGFFTATPRLTSAAWTEGSWKQTLGAKAPEGSAWLLTGPDNEHFTVGIHGVSRIQESSGSPIGNPTILGFQIPLGGGDSFVSLGPAQGPLIEEPFSASMQADTGDVAVYTSRTIRMLHRQPDGTYTQVQERKLEQAPELALISTLGRDVVLADQDGLVRWLNSDDLSTQRELSPVGKVEPRVVTSSPDGQWLAILFHNGQLVVFDAEGNERLRLGDSITAVTLVANQNLLVADRGTRVTRYELSSLKAAERFEPPQDMLQIAYRYAMVPFYRVFPKPGQLSNVVDHLLTRNTPSLPGMPGAAGERSIDDLRQSPIRTDIWGPIISSLAFVVVVLAVACRYVSRTDF